MTDTVSAPQPDADTLRQALVDQLKTMGVIKSAAVEAAFRSVPRHLFVPDVALETAYSDAAIPTKMQDDVAISSSSQPAIMAVMLEQLALEPGQRVLEIGAGTGYNAALMRHIVGERGSVITLDIDQDIVEGARQHLVAAGIHDVQVITADGNPGWPDAAPYDRIILTVGAWDIRPEWRDQLKANGRLVLPLGINPMTFGAAISFVPENDHLASLSAASAGFMPLRGPTATLRQAEHVELRPGLDLYFQQGNLVEAENVFALLNSPFTDLPTSVTRLGWEQVWWLSTWLQLHDERTCSVMASGEWLERDVVPAITGAVERRYSVGLTDGVQLALLMRDPGVPASDADTATEIRFFVRRYGASDNLAGQLINHLTAWQAANRPVPEKMHFKVYSSDAKIGASPDESIVRYPSAQLILSWN